MPNYSPTNPRYPNITVDLSGRMQNPFFMIGRVRNGMKYAGVPKAILDQFTNQARYTPMTELGEYFMSWVRIV